MYAGLCHIGSWGSLGSYGVWGGIGLILSLVFWLGLLAVLTLLVVWAIRRAPVRAATVSYANGQPTAIEILQARYARGEITREQYELAKKDIG
jgi:putative membrane protein